MRDPICCGWQNEHHLVLDACAVGHRRGNASRMWKNAPFFVLQRRGNVGSRV